MMSENHMNRLALVRGLITATAIAVSCIGCWGPPPQDAASQPAATPSAPAAPPATGEAAGEDWPTKRHDAQRTGITPEFLGLPMEAAWTHTASSAPAPAWTESPAIHDYLHKWYDLKPRQSFDRCFDVAVVGQRLFYGSSVTGAVTCLDSTTGEEMWAYFSGGPVRFAPHAVDDRVYFGSDDGFVYCLNAATGEEVWSERAGPEDDRIWGNEHMISVWPVRTSVLVEGGDVFWTAGIFPEEGMFLCKRTASDGSGGWTQPAQAPPQGYLLSLPGHVVVPTGKSYPRLYSTSDGACTGDLKASTRDGGSWAIITPDRKELWFGPTVDNQTQSIDVEKKTRIASVRDANCLVADSTHAYYSTDTTLVKIDRGNQSVAWARDYVFPHALIKAGDLLVAGGDGKVAAIDKDGEIEWSAPVDGKAYGLAVARKRLYVSTDTGSIHCFTALGPRVTCDVYPVDVASASAVLSGRLVTEGASSATVTAYWGPTDGGDDADGWESSTEARVSPEGTVTVSPEQLKPGTRYFYRFRAANAHGESWSATTGAFSTITLSIGATVESVTARDGETAAFSVERSAAGPDALQVSYQVSGSAEPGVHYKALSGTVTIPAGQSRASVKVEPLPSRAVARSDATLSLTLEKGPFALAKSATATVSLVSEPVDLGQWTQRMQVSFPGYTGAETLHDFPVPVVFDAAKGFDYSTFASPLGEDLRFTDGDGTVLLCHEVACWDPQGQSVVWVEVPELTGTDTHIQAYWGNANAGPAPASINANALWRSYEAVLHTDGASMPFDMAETDGVTPGEEGVVGKALRFHGGSFALPDVLGLGACDHTVSAWVRIPRPNEEGLKDGERVGILLGDFPEGAKCNFEIHADGKMRAFWNGGKIDERGTTDLRDGEWHFIAWARDKTAKRTAMYVDGKLDGHKDTAGADVAFSVQHIVGGDRRPASAPYFHGFVDELWIGRAARSEAWLRACLESQRPGNEFTQLGEVETVSAQSN